MDMDVGLRCVLLVTVLFVIGVSQFLVCEIFR